MCGIVAAAAVRGRTPVISTEAVVAMRDLLRERGPDDAGLWTDDQVHIGHRRLAINTPTDNQQPYVLAGERPIVLAFNGELYDCRALRRELESCGCRIRTGSDTELLAHAIATWGKDAPRRVRGMFSFVAWMPTTQTMLLSRDALGIIPLHYAILGHEIVVASEARAILSHPSISVQPDWGSVVHYLNSLRTTMGERTLFQGVRCVQPGETIRVDLAGDHPTIEGERWWRAPAEDHSIDEASAIALVRESVESSIESHLVSDVPIASLLSGGLDSTIIAAVARRSGSPLRTFCAGAVPEANGHGDLGVARRMAAALGTDHTEVGITHDLFLELWPQLISDLGMPLSTPNEVAIFALAQTVRPHAKVAMSGEGADELFAGYGPPLDEAAGWISRSRAGDATPVEEWHTNTFAWVPPSMFDALIAPKVLAAAGGAGICADYLRSEFAACGDPAALRTHVDLQRRLNLPSLLQRLNTSTMLASVEGRTPFADVRVAELAARIPLALHHPAAEPDSASTRGGVATATLPRTKRLLRAAFADLVPDEALMRPKASFPLPFEGWMADAVEALDGESIRTVLRPEAIEFVRARANEHWRLAWPVFNLGLWLQRWWG